MPAAEFNFTGPDRRIEQGARYLATFKIREELCDTWTVEVAGAVVGETYEIILFDSVSGDLPDYEKTVSYVAQVGDDESAIAAQLLTLLQALSWTVINDECEEESVSRIEASLSGTTITIRSTSPKVFLAVDTSGSTTPANLLATNTESVLIDITTHSFRAQLREDTTKPDPAEAEWTMGSEFTITNGPLGHLQLLLPTTETGAYTFECAVYDLLWDRGGGDEVFMMAGRIEVRLAVTR